MNVHEALRSIQACLQPKIGDFAVPQSEEIMQYLLKCSRVELYLKSNSSLPITITEEITRIVEQRLQGKPLQYILGKVYFYNREFNVTPAVLIPRPDTEILVEQILKNETAKQCSFADIGTGSGIIGCILSGENKGWKALSIDISYSALQVAKSNAMVRMDFLCSDLLSACKATPLFNFIVSNPPYISEEEMNTLDPEVRDHEPVHALYGGKDGLAFYKYLSKTGQQFIFTGGSMYCEIGYNQEYAVRELFSKDGWSEITVTRDYGNNPRVLHARKTT